MTNSSHGTGSHGAKHPSGNHAATHSTGSPGVANPPSPHAHLSASNHHTSGAHSTSTAGHSTHPSAAQHHAPGHAHHLPAHPHNVAAHPTRSAPHLHHVAPSHRHQIQHQALHGAAHADFVKSAKVSARQSELMTGVPASITIAQAILESGWGEKHLGKANNYFGVKAHVVAGKFVNGGIATSYVTTKTGEHIGGKDIKVVANFRAYKSMADSFTDHGQFLRDSPRYHSILEAYHKTGDVSAFSEGLQKAGYATDPAYASKLNSIIKKYELHKLDIVHEKMQRAVTKP